ncbi:toll/interleukin-1 receptor domain-containing protein [Pseudoalteromonas sp. JC3]|uniref:toll/interleukin-1 receptor domain-containing protein n=1 Tax=Pseudoalteromonas sp. JC3 TaxID=2810196 RepID=UPI0019CFAFAB|nr:toll/interleukin-1 receptor domain-containing protein [Pseudoalteromonas sp. JC3]MBR8842395.1 toll/interleukin-1 receptor domain-containing protein [Pseudoalteromonas sp. JC3]WJE09485.1 hypothetical protein QSH61_03145 [Pseudoalteromonas sp. JC3]
MFQGFNLNVSNESRFDSPSTYDEILKSREDNVRESLENFYNEEGLLNGDSLRKEWFPEIENCHVFISHSSKDRELALKLANWLYHEFKIESFIDSTVWGFADKLLKQIDNKYAYREETKDYSYEIRNYTTSHVHMMLSNALNSMIERSECLLFLNTENAIRNISLKEDREQYTFSPWIMAELQTSALIEKKQSPNSQRPFGSLESNKTDIESIVKRAKSFQMIHKANVEHLNNITCENLSEWAKDCNGEKGYNALTTLYRDYAPGCR